MGHLTLTLALLLAVAPALGATEEAREPSVAALDLAAALREVRTEAYDLGQVPAELEGRVVAALELDVDLLPETFDALAERRLPVVGEHAAQRLSIVQEELLLDALGSLSSGRVADARDAWLDGLREGEEGAVPLPDGAVDAAVRVTGATGLASELCLLFDLSPEQVRPGGALELALVDLMRADPRSLDRLRDCWFGAGEGRLGVCIAAVTTVGDPRGLAFLEDVARWSEEARPAAIGAVQAIGRGLDPAVNGSLGDLMTDLLLSEDPVTVRAAAQAVAILGHEAAVPGLIELLDLDAELVPEAGRLEDSAHWALRSLTGLGLPPEAGVWRRWHDEERAWLREDAAAHLRTLHGDEPAEVMASLAAFGRHRLGGTTIAPRVAELLDHPEPKVVVQACRLLGGYRDLRTVPALLDLLASMDAQLRDEAWMALTAVTGLALPAEPAAWRRELPLELQ